jgi:hypothetical protein
MWWCCGDCLGGEGVSFECMDIEDSSWDWFLGGPYSSLVLMLVVVLVLVLVPVLPALLVDIMREDSQAVKYTRQRSRG